MNTTEHTIVEKESPKKLYLISDDGKRRYRKSDKYIPRVSVNAKYGLIIFGNGAIENLAMADKFIKFYYDATNKVVAWRIENSISFTDMKLGWKRCKQNQKTGMMYFSIRSLLNNFIFKEGKTSFNKLPIQKYKEYGFLADQHTYYYVELK